MLSENGFGDFSPFANNTETFSRWNRIAFLFVEILQRKYFQRYNNDEFSFSYLKRRSGINKIKTI